MAKQRECLSHSRESLAFRARPRLYIFVIEEKNVVLEAVLEDEYCSRLMFWKEYCSRRWSRQDTLLQEWIVQEILLHTHVRVLFCVVQLVRVFAALCTKSFIHFQLIN